MTPRGGMSPEIANVIILDVARVVEDCRITGEASKDWLTVTTREYCTYEAELNCVAGETHTPLRSERYPLVLNHLHAERITEIAGLHREG